MFGTLKGRLLIIAALVIGGLATIWARGITLGLDLSGGIYLALEVADSQGVMTAEVRRDHIERNLEILRRRLDPTGTGEQTVQRVGNDRIVVELPGVTDIERARQMISQTAFLEFQLVEDLDPLISALPRMDRAIMQTLGTAALEDTATADADEGAGRLQQDVRERLFGRRDTTAADSAAADTATAPAGTPLSELLREGGAGELLVAEQDVERVRRFLALPEVRQLIPRGTELAWGADPQAVGAQLYRSLYLLDSGAFMTGENLENATAGRDPQFNQTVVYFDLDRRGGREFGRVTGANIGRRIAIVLDGEVHSAPVVESQITSNGVIQMGQAPIEEARDLALVLRAGAFSAPLEIVENRSIRPSLGQDAIDQGKVAGIIGIVVVILIMVGYYRIAGFLAVLALVFYTLLLLAGLSAVGAALTAPGIAGIILTLGMAVDANVLIFERIREELLLGRTVRAAVDNGFQHAMSAIVDSNITTLITGLVLYRVGTGPVQGFAVTLSLGIIASFISAVFVTRTFFMIYLDRRRAADAISI